MSAIATALFVDDIEQAGVVQGYAFVALGGDSEGIPRVGGNC